jgi:D-sedoheptulose 7-phosphate isomerase
MSDKILNHLKEAQNVLDRFIAMPEQMDNIAKAGSLLAECFQKGGKVISCGNGGSMCDAMHFAEELSGKFRDDRRALPAMAVSDPSYLSCVGNDYGYEKVFSRFIQAFGQKGDLLLAISTSGNSENVIHAARKAQDLNMLVIGLTGKDGGQLSNHCDIEIRAPKTDFADRAQEIHIKVIHILIALVEEQLKL